VSKTPSGVNPAAFLSVDGVKHPTGALFSNDRIELILHRAR
jgi:hypothetical protein